MELRLPFLLTTLTLLFPFSAARGSPPPLKSSSLPPAPAPASPVFHSGPSTLDPKQIAALQSLDFPTAHADPCANPSPRDNATACDGGAPFRHLISLRLANCSADLDLSSTALRALSTLRSLSFTHCPATAPRRLPPTLAANLRSFSCISSLHRLSGVWISHLENLTYLTVADVPIAASAPYVILSHTSHLLSLSITNANLSGPLPRHWHAIGLTDINLAGNRLTGDIPSSISLLASLQALNLSSNLLSGELPDSIGDLTTLRNASFANNSLSGSLPDSVSAISVLTHIDLSSNQFNGTIPRFFSSMKHLRYLNLENNNFHGVLPFNASFIQRLEVLKVKGNSNLCYNHTLLSSKLKLGIAKCDKYGMPVSAPPEKSSDDSSDYSDDGDDDDDSSGGKEKGDGGGHGPNKLVLGVAIGLAILVFLVVFCICISKRCG